MKKEKRKKGIFTKDLPQVKIFVSNEFLGMCKDNIEAIRKKGIISDFTMLGWERLGDGMVLIFTPKDKL